MGELTRDRVLRASDDWQWVPAGAEAIEVAGVPIIDYPEWARMGFYATPRTVDRPAPDVIRAVVEAARARGRSDISWWISPSTTPPSFEQMLIDHGAALDVRTEILAFDMTNDAPPMDINPLIECHVVRDAATLDDAERVAAIVWGGSPSGPERRAQQLRELGDPLDRLGGFRVVAYLDGRAIAAAGCQIVEDVARLYGAGTVPDARGRGGYRATLATRMQLARDNGARLALVHARVDTSMPILERIGFKSYGEARLYRLAGSMGAGR